MISTTKAQVPPYLRNSEFYGSLDDDGSEISIPRDCFKNNLTVTCSAELRQLLSTLRFWGTLHIPAELVRFVIFNKIVETDKVFQVFNNELVHLSFVRNLSRFATNCVGVSHLGTYATALRTTVWDANPMVSCARLCCVQFAFTNGTTWNAETCVLAAEFGTMEMLQWLHRHGCPWDATTCAGAARGNHLDSLKFAHENGCPWDSETCSAAAMSDHLECLQYSHENGCPWDAKTCSNALLRHSQRCFDYARERDCPFGPESCAEAAARGDLPLLTQLHESGCPWDAMTCEKASIRGHLDCIKYAHENGCPWEELTCTWAAMNGHLPVLKYAHENGCPWGTHTSAQAATKSLDCLRYVLEHGCPHDASTCHNAALSGGVAMLAFAHEHGCQMDVMTTFIAARFGRLHELQYAHEHGCPWAVNTCEMAAESGHLACLVYAHENGCEWSTTTCAAAATSLTNALACLQYAHKQGCAWDATTCINAGAAGNLDCLKYAHENGCPWDSNTCTAACEGGNLDCLVYAHERGCPLDGTLFACAGTAASKACIEYAKQHKCYPRLYFAREVLAFTTSIGGVMTQCKLAYYSTEQLPPAGAQVSQGFLTHFADVAYLSLAQTTIPVVCRVGDFAPTTVTQLRSTKVRDATGDGMPGYLMLPADALPTAAAAVQHGATVTGPTPSTTAEITIAASNVLPVRVVPVPKTHHITPAMKWHALSGVSVGSAPANPQAAATPAHRVVRVKRSSPASPASAAEDATDGRLKASVSTREALQQLRSRRIAPSARQCEDHAKRVRGAERPTSSVYCLPK